MRSHVEKDQGPNKTFERHISSRRKKKVRRINGRTYSVGGGGESRFSPRLGHGAALTPHCGVIHLRAGSTLPLYSKKEIRASLML